jgi:cell division cycle protein 20 (cofactor of APC complex)
MLHAYPSFDRVAEIRDAHECRVLFSAIGPAGDVVVTGAGDENLKFWRVWGQDVGASKGRKKGVKENEDVYGGSGDYLWGEGVSGNKASRSTRAGVLTIR